MAQRRAGKVSMKAVSSSVLYWFLVANRIPKLKKEVYIHFFLKICDEFGLSIYIYIYIYLI